MPEQILRCPHVQRTVGLSRSTIYVMIAEGEFPRPIKLGRRAVGWRESDIAEWLKNRTHDSEQ